MNPKILGAFLGGVVAAAGVFFIASRSRSSETPPAQTSQVQVSTPSVEPATAVPPAVEPPASVPAEPPVRKPEPSVAKKAPQPSPSVASTQPPPPVEPSRPPVATPAPTSAPEPVAPAPKVESVPLTPSPGTKDEPKRAAARAARTVTIPEGTLIAVSLLERVSSETHTAGDTFSAVLAEPLLVDGLVIAEKEGKAAGRIAQAERAGKVKGLARISLELTSVTSSDGQKINVTTGAFTKQGADSKKEDAAKVGVGAAIGAAIGAIAGGGKGAAIGAGAGGAAGAGTVVLTRGKDAELPVETRLSFRLSAPVTVTERLGK